MKKCVQTPTNHYCTFCKYVAHDEKYCRAYYLLHERSRYTYIIQGKVQQDGNTTQFNSPGRGKFNPRDDSEEEDEEEAWVEVEVRSFVITVHNQITWQGTV
jgi:hypothetical protein